jgi:hypothetical protein
LKEYGFIIFSYKNILSLAFSGILTIEEALTPCVRLTLFVCFIAPVSAKQLAIIIAEPIFEQYS